MRYLNAALAVSGALLSALVVVPSAQADEFHFSNLLVGERPSGLGGAYTALSDDHTGMVYNPAGIAFADAGREVASINLFAGTSVTYDQVFGNKGWTRSSGELVPGFFGGLFELSEDSMAGYVLSVRDSLSEDQDQVFKEVTATNAALDPNGSGTFSEVRVNSNINYRWYDAGFSYAKKLNDGWSWGVSLLGHYRTHDVSFNQRILDYDTDDTRPNTQTNDASASVFSSREWTEYGFRPRFGIRWAGEKHSFGATLANTVVLSRDYRYQSAFDLISPTVNGSEDTLHTSSQKQKFPLELKIGGAFQMTPALKLIADVSYFGKTTHDYEFSDDPANADAPPAVLDTKAFTNFAIAFEYATDSAYSYRGAIFTDNANTDVSSVRKLERREEIDSIGITFSVTHTDTNGQYWNLGALVSSGDGDATLGDFGFGNGQDAVVEASRLVYSIYVGHSF